ncbi:weak chloroplast movement under blue light protein [Actinidia rufa]|uniref:Weak chloroplast movement under blue light protein n=1 Tax=Actinidia rufa TaxID=165716 RepID=A0A7J0DZC0_9ERIC|nr:weak chloroplast movement under blue light protein [Actinidia rufa]
MFGFSIRTRQNASGSPRGGGGGSTSTVATPRSIGGSPRTEVGEIDTRAPFQSVKAAVSLFGGEGASPKARPVLKKPKTAEERVLERETQLHLAVKELDKFKEQLKSAETTKAQALRSKRTADAQHATKVNTERSNELSKEIATMRDTLNQVKLAMVQAEEEQAKSAADKEDCLKSLTTAKEEVDKKILLLKQKESDLKLWGNLEEKLEESTEAIAVIQEQLKNVQESDLESLRTVALELEDAKNVLQEVLREENLLRSSVDALKLEVDEVKRDCSKCKEKEEESESVAENLRGELERSKVKLEETLAGERKQEEASDDMHLKLLQNVAKETEEKLQAALEEAEEAKAAEKLVSDQIRITPARDDATNSETRDKIKLSAEDFESLSKKVEVIEKLAQMKVAAATAEVEASNASEREAVKRLEASLKEMEDIKAATEDALKKAEMADAAKQVVEGELQKWRQQEQNKETGETSSSHQDPEGSLHLQF